MVRYLWISLLLAGCAIAPPAKKADPLPVASMSTPQLCRAYGHSSAAATWLGDDGESAHILAELKARNAVPASQECISLFEFEMDRVNAQMMGFAQAARPNTTIVIPAFA